MWHDIGLCVLWEDGVKCKETIDANIHHSTSPGNPGAMATVLQYVEFS